MATRDRVVKTLQILVLIIMVLVGGWAINRASNRDVTGFEDKVRAAMPGVRVVTIRPYCDGNLGCVTYLKDGVLSTVEFQELPDGKIYFYNWAPPKETN